MFAASKTSKAASGVVPDQYFDYVTALLNTSGTNGAQNNTFIDSSTNNFTITRNGNTTQGSFSPFGENWSNYFDGTGDYLSVADNPSLDGFTGDVTIEFWVNYSSTAAGAALSKGWNGGSFSPYLFLLSSGSLVLFASSNGAGWDISSGQTIVSSVVSNTWYHIAISRSGSSLRLFANGVLSTTITTSATFMNSSDALTVGSSVGGFTPMTGYVANVRIVRGTALYTANFTPSTVPLQPVAGTSLLTCKGPNIVDDSANQFTITRNGDVSVHKFGPFAGTTLPTPYFSGFFDGTGDSLTTPTSSVFNVSGDFTIEGWYNFAALPAANTNDNLWVFTGYSPYLYLWGDGTLILRTSQTAGTVFTYTHNFALSTWYHIAVVKSGTTFTLYINGTSAATGTSSAITSVNKSLLIGDASTFGLQGSLSNFRVVNGQVLYASNFTPSTVPLTTTSQGATASNVSLLTCQSSQFIDNSPNNFSLTIAGNTRPTTASPFTVTYASQQPYTPAVFGGSAYFDGAGDYLQIAANTIFDFGSDNFTIECWVYPLTSGVQTGLISNWQTGGQFILRKNSGNRPTFVYDPVDAGSVTVTGTTTTIVTGSWNHVAVVRNNNVYTMYVNGIPDATTSTNTAALEVKGRPLRIGADGDATALFTGYISGTRIVKGTALYTSSFVPQNSPPAPVTNTSLLLNGTSAAITDATTRNVVETVGDARISTAVAKFGGSSMYFDGSGDRLIVPSSPNFDFTGDFTIEMWINFANVTSTWEAIISRAYALTGGWRLYKSDGNNQLVWYSNVTPVVSTSGSTLANNTWSHIAVVRNSGTVTIYIDGVNRGSAANTTSYTPGNYALEIGEGVVSSSYPFEGYIQDLRITKTARYAANFTPPTTAFQTR